MKNNLLKRVQRSSSIIFILAALFLVNSTYAQLYNTLTNSNQGVAVYIDNDNNHVDEDMVWIFDKNSWSDGSRTETMRLSKDRLTLYGDVFARGHMFLYPYEGLGANGTAYIQARDLSGYSNSIALQFRTQKSGMFYDALRIAPNGNVGIGVGSPNGLLQFPSDFNPRKIVLFEHDNNENQYAGFGMLSTSLRYQVGTTASDHLFFAGSNSTTSKELMRIKGNGKVGIGVTNPTAPLHLINGVLQKKLVLHEDVDNSNQFYGFGINNNVFRYQVNSNAASHVFYAGTNATSSKELMRIKGNGSVGIGVDSNRFEPGCKLNVNGATYIGDFSDGYNAGFVHDSLLDNYMLWVEKGIVTEDLAIGHVQTWSDYVFEDSYSLPSLQELEKFIRANKHLPAIPSEAEVKEKGYSQHKLNNGFLKTIEELSLYAISQDKQIAGLQDQVKQQQKVLEDMTDKAKKLESLTLEVENLKKLIAELSKR